ncbi:hypothetical protein CerSpe_062900 [Prunus speciosa]
MFHFPLVVALREDVQTQKTALMEDGCPKVWVVTFDHIQQHAAHGAGAFIWSCNALVSEIKASQKEFERMLQEHRVQCTCAKALNLDENWQARLERDIIMKLHNVESYLI